MTDGRHNYVIMLASPTTRRERRHKILLYLVWWVVAYSNASRWAWSARRLR